MMNRYLTYFCTVVALILLTACTEPEPPYIPDPQPLSGQILHTFRIPSLLIRYTIDDIPHEIRVRAGVSDFSWTVNYDDGTSMITTWSVDEERHKLDIAPYEPIIERGNNDIKLAFIFEHPVELTTGARRWPIAFIGQGEQHRNSFELIDISDRTLFISSEEEGYVIQINARVRRQGNVTYVFSVK